MSQEASNAISTIPKTGGTTEDPCDVDVLRDETEASLRTVTCCWILDVEVIVLFVHEVPNLLQKGDCVRKLPGMLAELHQTAEQVFVVGDVEIASQDEIS